MESQVIGVKSLCLEGLVDYSIQAEDIIIYLCAFQGTFGCFFANIAVFCPTWCQVATLYLNVAPNRHHDSSMFCGYILRCPTYLGPGE